LAATVREYCHLFEEIHRANIKRILPVAVRRRESLRNKEANRTHNEKRARSTPFTRNTQTEFGRSRLFLRHQPSRPEQRMPRWIDRCQCNFRFGYPQAISTATFGPERGPKSPQDSG
jgi:hypothetical protein